MSQGVLVDMTKCFGCGACTVACKLWNEKKYDEVTKPTLGEAAKLVDINWTVVSKHDVVDKAGHQAWRFAKKQCLHCVDPACASSCLVGALRRTNEGPVVYHPDLCVGCMYCLAACPYQVRFINPVTKVADKCDFCRKTNLAAGKEPACVESCPTKALVFGNLDDPDSPIAKRLVKETTYRYKQGLGTSPKMYRVPKGEITP